MTDIAFTSSKPSFSPLRLQDRSLAAQIVLDGGLVPQ